jgi:hypothetical protein
MTADVVLDAIELVKQVGYPDIDPAEMQAWFAATIENPDYYWAIVGEAICIAKVYNQVDPPWLRIAHEVGWWGGTKRDRVRALHKAMNWAKLRGATMFGYSFLTDLSIVKWRRLT